ncbi:MAG: hypothetical protein U0835_21240 [Isosphaeraceae bacterium]
MIETDLNVRPEQKVCVAAVGLAFLLVVLSVWRPWLLAAAAACPTLVVALNFGFYRFLARKRGVAFAAGSVPLHLVYYGCCGASVVLALAYWYLVPASARTGAPAPAPWLLRRGARGGQAPAPHLSKPRRPSRWTGR